MKQLFFTIFTLSFLAGCNNATTRIDENNSTMNAVSQVDTSQHSVSERNNASNPKSCYFVSPDTSVSRIKIRNSDSVLASIGKPTKLDGGPMHFFYSNDKKQKLGLTVNGGDNYNQVSVFSIAYVSNEKTNLPMLDPAEFETEKGINLGIHKKEILEKLGTCYVAKDSTANMIELNYRMESPNDSPTRLLKRANMPIYYAIYRLTNDKLENIEFGFENP